jgi:AraC-like DNA-binding protein
VHGHSSTSTGDWARFRPGPVAGVTLMNAHFKDHCFERHSHETYSIGLTHTGVQTFHCAGSLCASLPGDLILFNPDQAHDGQRGAPEGFGYSIVYVPAEVVDDCADRGAGIEFPRHFRQPVVRDPVAARSFDRTLDALAQPGESLRAEECLRHLLAALLVRHGEPGPRRAHARRVGDRRMARVRDHLQASYAQDVTVQSLAELGGLSRAHLSRAFAAHFGVPPHVYLNAVRIRHAQAAMLAGEPLAGVAAACGFADQAHFSRRFKGAVGVPPSQWLRQMRSA